MRRFVLLVAAFVAVLAIEVTPSLANTPTPGTNPLRVVVFRDGVNAASRAAKLGVRPEFIYRYALSGFAAELTPQQQAKLAGDRDVLMVTLADRDAAPQHHATPSPLTPIEQTPQIISHGLQRVGALESKTARIDGHDNPMNVDIAVIDSGIQVDQPDLRVVGGADCTGDGSGISDQEGHGTEVAGILAARDNAFGIVGVAPGARLWSVRIFDANDVGTDANLLCGIDWVTHHDHLIEVTNLSLEDNGGDDGHCGLVNHDPVHWAICQSVQGGMTYVAGAGNEAADASAFMPASFPEVITASAMSDTDGLPGGLGPVDCLGEPDDSFAYVFSNFGPAIDIAAPAVCVGTTYIGSQLAVDSGTSFAAPKVAGAVALIKVQHPFLSPAGVKAMILAAREQVHLAGDPDGIDEGVLNVASF